MQRRSFLQLVSATAACVAVPVVVDEDYTTPVTRGIEKHWVVERCSYTGRAVALQIPGQPQPFEPLWVRGTNAGLYLTEANVKVEEAVTFPMSESEWEVYKQRGRREKFDYYASTRDLCERSKQKALLNLRNRWASEFELQVQHLSDPVQLVTVIGGPLTACFSLYGYDYEKEQPYFYPHVEVNGQVTNYLVRGTVTPLGRVWSEDGRVPLDFEVDPVEAQTERDRQMRSRIQVVEDVEEYERKLQDQLALGHINTHVQNILAPEKQRHFEAHFVRRDPKA